VRLLVAFEALPRKGGIKLDASGEPFLMAYNRFMESARAQLDPATFEASQQTGRALTQEQALALATSDEP
jgi:hypothetical protein